MCDILNQRKNGTYHNVVFLQKRKSEKTTICEIYMKGQKHNAQHIPL